MNVTTTRKHRDIGHKDNQGKKSTDGVKDIRRKHNVTATQASHITPDRCRKLPVVLMTQVDREEDTFFYGGKIPLRKNKTLPLRLETPSQKVTCLHFENHWSKENNTGGCASWEIRKGLGVSRRKKALRHL